MSFKFFLNNPNFLPWAFLKFSSKNPNFCPGWSSKNFFNKCTHYERETFKIALKTHLFAQRGLKNRLLQNLRFSALEVIQGFSSKNSCFLRWKTLKTFFIKKKTCSCAGRSSIFCVQEDL